MSLSQAPEKPAIEIPRAANIEDWADRDWKDGVQVDKMAELETLVVKTRHTTYEITVISGSEGEVLVRGGQYFPEKTPAHLSGASLGGSFLKLRGIYLGLKMEFMHNRRRIITSPVQSIAVG